MKLFSLFLAILFVTPTAFAQDYTVVDELVEDDLIGEPRTDLSQFNLSTPEIRTAGQFLGRIDHSNHVNYFVHFSSDLIFGSVSYILAICKGIEKDDPALVSPERNTTLRIRRNGDTEEEIVYHTRRAIEFYGVPDGPNRRVRHYTKICDEYRLPISDSEVERILADEDFTWYDVPFFNGERYTAKTHTIRPQDHRGLEEFINTYVR